MRALRSDFDPVLAENLDRRVREVPDFPKPGITFKDLTPVLAHGPSLGAIVERLAARYRAYALDAVVAIESRGFLVGAPLAAALGTGVVIVRKPGKLPWKTRQVSYALEYGTDTLEIHEDALAPGARVVVVDDVLATGGTMAAAVQLVQGLGARVAEAAFVVELGFLGGRARLGVPAASLLVYD